MSLSTYKNPSFVSKGDPIRAEDTNNQSIILEKFLSVNKNRGFFGSELRLGGGTPALTCQARNIGPGPIYLYGACVIVGTSIKESYANRTVVLDVRIPVVGDDVTRLAIARERILNGRIGVVTVSGLAWAWVAGTGNFGFIQTGENWLTLGPSGPAQVLHIYPTVQIGLVRIGGGGSSNLGTTGGSMWKGKIVSSVLGVSGKYEYTVSLLDWDESTILGQYINLTTFPPLPFALANNSYVWLVFDPTQENPAAIIP